MESGEALENSGENAFDERALEGFSPLVIGSFSAGTSSANPSPGKKSRKIAVHLRTMESGNAVRMIGFPFRVKIRHPIFHFTAFRTGDQIFRMRLQEKFAGEVFPFYILFFAPFGGVRPGERFFVRNPLESLGKSHKKRSPGPEAFFGAMKPF